MDEDLKIILTSELEADEQASAQRISAQLPNIAKLINSRSSIKVGVSLDESTVRSDTQRISQQIARATQSQTVGVSLNLDQSSVNKIRAELNNLKVSPDISRAMTDQLDRMGIQIDRITVEGGTDHSRRGCFRLPERLVVVEASPLLHFFLHVLDEIVRKKEQLCLHQHEIVCYRSGEIVGVGLELQPVH